MEKTAFLNREAVTASQEGTLAVELFLMSHYRFRRNILNGKVEFVQLGRTEAHRSDANR